MTETGSELPPAPEPVRRRAAIVLVVVAILVGVALIADVLAVPPPALPPEPVAQETPQAGAWYCPATAGEGESAVLSVAAVGEDPSRVTVVRYPDREPAADEPVDVAPGDEHTVILGPGEATTPVSVRWEGGPAVASWRIESGDTPGAPCEPGPAEIWHLAGLDTARGATSTVHLFNPFATDAVARITFATPEGRVALLLTDNLLVEAGTSARIDLGEFQPEQPDLGATVEVLTGRLVAQGELVLQPVGEQGGPSGRALIPAASGPGALWSFGYARVDESSSSALSVVNTGDREAAVEVQVSNPRPEAGVQEHSVAPGGVLTIDLAELSEEPEFGVSAQSVNDVPIVVHRVTTIDAEGREGLAVSRGAPLATRWALVGAGTADRRGRVLVYNPGVELVTVEVTTNGAVPDAWRGLEIPPNAWRSFSLVDAEPDRAQIPAMVAASGPVVAELRSHHQSGALRLWTALGIRAETWAGGGARPAVHRDPRLAIQPLGAPAAEREGPAPLDPGELPEVPGLDDDGGEPAPEGGEGQPPPDGG
ncbi:MAG: DUF5719 family protein [Egibacteraceae bacterium]